MKVLLTILTSSLLWQCCQAQDPVPNFLLVTEHAAGRPWTQEIQDQMGDECWAVTSKQMRRVGQRFVDLRNDPKRKDKIASLNNEVSKVMYEGHKAIIKAALSPEQIQWGNRAADRFQLLNQPLVKSVHERLPEATPEQLQLAAELDAKYDAALYSLRHKQLSEWSTVFPVESRECLGLLLGKTTSANSLRVDGMPLVFVVLLVAETLFEDRDFEQAKLRIADLDVNNKEFFAIEDGDEATLKRVRQRQTDAREYLEAFFDDNFSPTEQRAIMLQLMRRHGASYNASLRELFSELCARRLWSSRYAMILREETEVLNKADALDAQARIVLAELKDKQWRSLLSEVPHN